MQAPSFQDVLDARPRVYAGLQPSPLRLTHNLAEGAGAASLAAARKYAPARGKQVARVLAE